ncbi:MAG: hypothetical protein ABIX01_03925 [Chitinophagaceae bacterium]
METTTVDEKMIDNYLNQLKALPDIYKRQIIARLELSMRPRKPEPTPEEMDKLFASFKFEKSAEEMIEEIYSSRTSSPTRSLE